MTPALAAAIRVLASFDRLEWRAGLGGVRPVRADGTMGPLRSIHVLQLQGLVNRGLVEVEYRNETRIFRLSALGRLIASEVDLREDRRDAALAAEVDEMLAARRAS